MEETMVLEQLNQDYHKTITNLFHRGKHCFLSWCSLFVKSPHPRWPPGGSGRFPVEGIDPPGLGSPVGRGAALRGLPSRDRPKWVPVFRLVTGLFPPASYYPRPQTGGNPSLGIRTQPEGPHGKKRGAPLLGATATSRSLHFLAKEGKAGGRVHPRWC